MWKSDNDVCPHCGYALPLNASICANCEKQVGDVLPDTHPVDRTEHQSLEKGYETACWTVGMVFSVIGVVFLLNPSIGGTFEGTEIVNLQRLYIGQTAALIGAIFLAAAMRPRR